MTATQAKAMAITTRLFETMTTFFSTQCMRIGCLQTRKDTNTLQTATTNSPEKTESLRSFRLRHIFDDKTFPALSMQVCLSGPEGDRWGFKPWLGRAGCRFVDKPEDSDFVIFTGGSDVSPHLYDEVAIAETCADPQRDEEDVALYKLCRSKGIPMVGVCRGAQFLWVMMGGKLFQHVDNHNNGEHEIYFFPENKKYRSSSVHHQMARPEALPGMKLLANSVVSKHRKSNNWTHSGPGSDFEIFAFEKEGILCFQGHPEYPGFPNYSDLCTRLIDKYIYDSEHTVYKDGKIRVKTNVLEMPMNKELN